MANHPLVEKLRLLYNENDSEAYNHAIDLCISAVRQYLETEPAKEKHILTLIPMEMMEEFIKALGEFRLLLETTTKKIGEL